VHDQRQFGGFETVEQSQERFAARYGLGMQAQVDQRQPQPVTGPRFELAKRACRFAAQVDHRAHPFAPQTRQIVMRRLIHPPDPGRDLPAVFPKEPHRPVIGEQAIEPRPQAHPNGHPHAGRKPARHRRLTRRQIIHRRPRIGQPETIVPGNAASVVDPARDRH